MSSRGIPRQAPNTSSVQSVGQNLFYQLLQIGEKLLQADPELYKTAVAHLQEHVPREPSPVRRAAGAEQKGVQGDHSRRSSTAFHKYVLPGDAGKREYYQCMTCSERRTTNSFHADHQHEGQKYVIRWYCPLCDTLYAVTHRGYHIKNRHKTLDGKTRSPKSSRSKASSASSEEGEDDENYVPPRHGMKRAREDDDTSVGSEETTVVNILSSSSNKPPPPIAIVGGSTPATVTPQPLVSQPSEQVIPPPEPDRITHTVTQEALLGSSLVGVANMPSESVLQFADRLGDSGSTLATSNTENKLLFAGTSATITRQ